MFPQWRTASRSQRTEIHLFSRVLSGASFILFSTVIGAQLIGRVPDAAFRRLLEIEDADETQLVFGLSNRGVSFAMLRRRQICLRLLQSSPLRPAFSPRRVRSPVDSAVLAGQNSLLSHN